MFYVVKENGNDVQDKIYGSTDFKDVQGTV